MPDGELTWADYVRLLERIDLRREQRRSYEWKVTLGLWAGLIAAAKFVADSADNLAGRVTGCGAWVAGIVLVSAGLVLVAGHAAYHIRFVRPAHDYDLDAAREIEEKLGVKPSPQNLAGPAAQGSANAAATDDNFGAWSSTFQVAGSIALTLLAELIAWVALFGD